MQLGMDVIGMAPTSKTGEYFRASVWWWRPLWEYCLDVAPVARKVKHGQCNDSDGLNAADARRLAAQLRAKIDSGRTATAARARDVALARMPTEFCDWCDGTGARIDLAGIPCARCRGTGRAAPWATVYRFDLETVRDFAAFCEASGGFKIL